MTKEELIRNLKYTMEKHKNDNIPTFGTNISLMCKDILDYLEQEHCDYAVSRAELLKAIDTWDKFGLDDTNHTWKVVDEKEKVRKRENEK